MAGKRATLRRLIAWLLLAPVLAVLAFGLAALIGGAIPVNSGWREPETGVRIFVEDNGVHTGIVVPVVAEGVDWRDLVRPEDIADPRHAAHGWLAFGWGDREFYLNTPTWADMTVGRTLMAFVGSGQTVLHVEHVAQPVPGRSTRTILLRPEEYRRLAARIRATFATGADGRATSRYGYAKYDSFYTATGRYGLFVTCNQWTGSVLRAAGVRMGAWTPFSRSVMRWLPDPERRAP